MGLTVAQKAYEIAHKAGIMLSWKAKDVELNIEIPPDSTIIESLAILAKEVDAKVEWLGSDHLEVSTLKQPCDCGEVTWKPAKPAPQPDPVQYLNVAGNVLPDGPPQAHHIPKLSVILKKLPNIKAVPTYNDPGASGADLYAAIEVTIEPKGHAIIPTGICIEMPAGYEAQVRARLSLARDHKVVVTNGVGTVSSSCRDEILVLLTNLGEQPYTVNPGDKIAQLVFSQVLRGVFRESQWLSPVRKM